MLCSNEVGVSENMVKSLLTIAEKTRAAFEEIALYEGQPPQFLSGYCYRAASQLLMVAQEFGFDLKMASSCYHVFNIFDQGNKRLIVDITATQFDNIQDKVFVCDVDFAQDNLKHWKFHQEGGIFNGVEEFFNKTFWDLPYACLIADRIFVSKRLDVPRALPEEIDRKSWEKFNECYK